MELHSVLGKSDMCLDICGRYFFSLSYCRKGLEPGTTGGSTADRRNLAFKIEQVNKPVADSR